MTPVPDYIAGARALLAASSDCTINGEPAVVVRVAELNDLVARVHRAEAAAPPEPAAILAVVETAVGDQLTDTARAEALDGIRRVLAAAVAAPATADDALRERVAAAIRALNEGGTMADLEDEADVYGLADAVLAVRDRRMEQRTEEARWLRRTAQTNIERLVAVGLERDGHRRRAEQAEDLLRAAHVTSNRSEAERARAVQRAEQAEATVARVRSLMGRWAKRTDQLKRAAELLDDALDGPGVDRA